MQLTDDQVLAALRHRFGQHYDKATGQRLLQKLLLRRAKLPINSQHTGSSLGSHFPLLGYRSLVGALSDVLNSMEFNLMAHTDPMTYKRSQHIVQLAGPPGLGKTTAATAMWAALHCACSSSGGGGSSPMKQLLPDDSPNWERMRQRILRSLTPSKLLVFNLDFSTGELSLASKATQCSGFKGDIH